MAYRQDTRLLCFRKKDLIVQIKFCETYEELSEFIANNEGYERIDTLILESFHQRATYKDS